MEPQWKWGMKVCSPHLGHMTKVATMPIYGKKPYKYLLPWNQRANGPGGLVFSIGEMGTIMFENMITLGWSWPFFMERSISFTLTPIGKTLKIFLSVIRRPGLWCMVCSFILWTSTKIVEIIALGFKMAQPEGHLFSWGSFVLHRLR